MAAMTLGSGKISSPIASITLSNGADNVRVYIAFFNINRTHLWQNHRHLSSLVGSVVRGGFLVRSTASHSALG
jgi:hypothetical protein